MEANPAARYIGGIPRDVFDARSLPYHEGFDVWRQSVSPLFEPELDDDTSLQSFFVRVDGVNLGQMVFCLADFSGQRYVRRPGYRAGDATESILIQLYLTGGYVGQNANRPVRVRPGDISLLDLAYPLETRAETSSTLSLVVPRDALISLVGSERIVPGSVIEGQSAVGRILTHHLTSVWNSLSDLRAGEERHIARTLLGTLAGAFAGENFADRADVVHTGEFYSATLDAICAYIDRNLQSDRLTPAHLCERFACSRAKLYRLFDPLGGIAAYIRQARLERCRRELRNPKNRGASIAEIAMRWGFNSHSHFCRLFRAAFGVSPSEVQEQAHVLFPPASRAITLPRPALHDWLRQI